MTDKRKPKTINKKSQVRSFQKNGEFELQVKE
jgi:hypothetical protein